MEDQIGRLTYDEKLRWWKGKLEIAPDEEIGVRVVAKKNQIRDVLADAEFLFKKVKKNKKKIEAAVVKSLSIKKIKLESIVIDPRGKDALLLYYEDGGGLDRRSIVVKLDEELKLIDVLELRHG